MTAVKQPQLKHKPVSRSLPIGHQSLFNFPIKT